MSIGWLQGGAQWDQGRPDVLAASRAPKYGRSLPVAARGVRLAQRIIHSIHGAGIQLPAHLEHKTEQTASGRAE